MPSINTSQPFQCPICKEWFTSGNAHHIYPIALGGPQDGKLIQLCNQCHDNIHLTAKALLSKTKKAQQRQYFTDLDELERAKPLIDFIVKVSLENEGKQSGVRRRRIYILNVSDITHQRLHKLKADYGYTNLTKFLDDLFENLGNGTISLKK